MTSYRRSFSTMDRGRQSASSAQRVSSRSGLDEGLLLCGSSAACPEDQFQDLLAREVLRDERLLALEQEVMELRDLVGVLAAIPVPDDRNDDCNDEEWGSASCASTPLGCCPSIRAFSVEGQVEGGVASRAWSLLTAVEAVEELQDAGTEWEAPPTMYAYCVFHISNSDNPLLLKESWFLVVMLVCQVTLVHCFSVSDSLNSLKTHMKSFYDSSVATDECIYWPMVFHHRPLVFISSVVCTTVVVLCYLKAKDRDTMMTLHTEPRSIFARCLINYAWFIQAIWLPGMFCGCTANLLWSSESARGAVMNSVSLAYLLELDSYMFTAFISDEQKAAYRKELSSIHKSVNFAEIHRVEWLLYFAGIAQCVVLSMWLHYLNWFDVLGASYHWCLWASASIYTVVYGVRASLIRVQRPRTATHECLSTARSPLTYSVLGLSHFVVLTLLMAPQSLYPPLTNACFKQFLN